MNIDGPHIRMAIFAMALTFATALTTSLIQPTLAGRRGGDGRSMPSRLDVGVLSSAARRRTRQYVVKRPELRRQPKSFQPAFADEFLQESVQSVLEEVRRLGQRQRSRASPVWMGLGVLAGSFVQLALVEGMPWPTTPTPIPTVPV